MSAAPPKVPGKFDLTTPEGRKAAEKDYMWFGDHAILRKLVKNRHWVDEGRLMRGNQPSPAQLAELKDAGFKTIINLRGGDGSFALLEREACEKLGLKLVDLIVTSREVPSRERVLNAKTMFETIEYPAFMHCKSGADRAGLMSVLYAHFVLGQPIRQAKGQLAWKYLHAKIGKTGVLDYMFERYLTDAEPKSISFIDWVKSDAYDPAEMKANFRAKWWGSLLTEHILRRE
jgi:protein tyrosine/serine phosphatase